MNQAFDFNKSNWNKVNLGDLAEEISVRVDVPKDSLYKKFVGLEHFRSGVLKIDKCGTTENLVSSTKAFKRGDILFARRNAYLKRASLVEFDGVCSGDAFVLRENRQTIVPGFLSFIVNSNSLWEFANSNAAGTMSKRVKWRDLAEYELLMPPIEQQNVISELLWLSNNAILNSSSSLLALQTLYKSQREFLNFIIQNDSELIRNSVLKSEVNINIEFDKLDNHLKSIKYGTSKKANNIGAGKGVLGIPNVVNEKLTLDKLAHVELTDREYAAASLKKGDILIVRSNGNPSYTGRSAIYDLDEGHVYASYLIKITIDQEVFDPEFFVRYLQTDMARRYFKRHATSSAGNYNINTDTIKGLPVPIFSLDYQRDVVGKLKKIESLIFENLEQVVTSKKLLNGLINKVF